MANSSEINTRYETYKAVDDRTAISLVLEKKLDYREFLRLNEGKFKIISTTYYLIAGLIYLLKEKPIEIPEVYRTDTRSDDKVEQIAVLAGTQNINSDEVYESESNELRELVESQGNLNGIIQKFKKDNKKLNQPSYETNEAYDFLYKNYIKRW